MKQLTVSPRAWWCDVCRHLIDAPTRQDKIDHMLDEHRDALLAGRVKVITKDDE